MGKCAVLVSEGDCRIQSDASNGPNPASSVRTSGSEVKITAPVGINSPNIYDDVFNIQNALNKVPPVDGGPQTKLVTDGRCGEKTIKAIQNFQLKHFGWSGADGKIEPYKQTIAKLNEIIKRYNFQPALPLNTVDDAWFLAAMMQHIPYTKECVQAAMANLLMAMPLADSKLSGGFGREEQMKLLNRHFLIDSFPAPRPVLQRLYDIYSYMLTVLNRPDAYFTLDTDNSGEGISSIAVTPLGGFFGKDADAKIKFRRGAYFASGIQQYAAHIIIHELRHFVEREGEHGHLAKGWVTDPKMQAMLPSQRIYNCDTFANFALEARNGIMERPSWIKSNAVR